MTDIHSHIIFDVDDGAKTLEESLNILIEAEEAGFKHIICTPHYLEATYETFEAETIKKFMILEEQVQANNIGIKLYLGNEVYITPDINERISKKHFFSLNNTQYVLVETSMHTKILYLDYEIEKIIEAGYIPILAHPERYEFVKKDITSLNSLLEKGVLLQGNYGSIIGLYGKQAEQTLKKLLKQELITFMASDTHMSKTIYAKMPEIQKRLKKIIERNYFLDITRRNARKIIYTKNPY